MGLKTVASRKEFLWHKHRTAIVMFSGEQCPACVASKPQFTMKANQSSEKNFLLVDARKLQLTPADIGFTITAIPCFASYRKNKIVNGPVTGYNEAKIQAMIKK